MYFQLLIRIIENHFSGNCEHSVQPHFSKLDAWYTEQKEADHIPDGYKQAVDFVNQNNPLKSDTVMNQEHEYSNADENDSDENQVIHNHITIVLNGDHVQNISTENDNYQNNKVITVDSNDITSQIENETKPFNAPIDTSRVSRKEDDIKNITEFKNNTHEYLVLNDEEKDIFEDGALTKNEIEDEGLKENLIHQYNTSKVIYSVENELRSLGSF